VVADPLEPGIASPPDAALGRLDASKMVPVTAEDVARRRSRIGFMILAAALAITALGGWIYKRSTDPLRAQESYDDGQRLFAASRYDQAALALDRAIALQPNFPDAYLTRARCRVMAYDTAGALPDFTRAIELRPGYAAALMDRASAYLLLKNYSAASADASAALTIDPSLAAAYNLRGRALRDGGDLQKALENFNRAVELKPNGDSYYQRGATEQALGNHRLAIADFSESIDYKPEMAEVYFARAESERALGETEAARRDHLHARIIDGR
jgi:tetratricopeptide (TPR) repeat protein